MDELLRAYAKKRREQAEPALQMHPATRKLLQNEVKRTLGATPPPPRQSWQTFRWPLLALWCGFAALLVMFAVINTQMRNLLPAIAPPDRSLSQAKPMLKVTVPAAEGAASTAPLVSAAERKRADFKPPQKFPAPAAASIVAATHIAPAQPSETRLMEAAAPTQPSSAGILSDARTGSSAPALPRLGPPPSQALLRRRRWPPDRRRSPRRRSQQTTSRQRLLCQRQRAMDSTRLPESSSKSMSASAQSRRSRRRRTFCRYFGCGVPAKMCALSMLTVQFMTDKC